MDALPSDMGGAHSEARAPSDAGVETCASEAREVAQKTSGQWWSLLLGQLISILITGTGVFSSFLTDDDFDAPVVQSSLNYILLSLNLFAARSEGDRGTCPVPWWKYALWAIVDVEANFLVVWAYQYTSIASVMLLDSFTIPSCMVLSYWMLAVRYKASHIIACGVCAAGLACTVFSDVLSDVGVERGASWRGDLLCLLGSVLYGLSNVLQESFLKGADRARTLGMLGLFGSVISGVQALALELPSLEIASWSLHLWLCLLGFQFCLFSMYMLTSIFLGGADATLFNLSLLTSDVYSVIFAWLCRGRRLRPLYGVGWFLTVSGLVIYHTRELSSDGAPQADRALAAQLIDDCRLSSSSSPEQPAEQKDV